MNFLAGSESDRPEERREERKFIERAKKRDPAAMRELIDAHKDRLFAFVWRMTHHHHDAEEICQEAFLRAFGALETFDPTYRFSTWLFTIAYRLTLNAGRRRRPVGGEMDLSLMAANGESAGEQAACSEEAQRLRNVVWQAVEELTPPQRAAVLMFYQQQQGCHEIAEVLQIPVATVKSHLHRARARLKAILEPQLTESTRERILGELAG
jgi:RNA polymerase sigma-70 factor (ECF subfamily)